jgi:hypothetical protein
MDSRYRGVSESLGRLYESVMRKLETAVNSVLDYTVDAVDSALDSLFSRGQRLSQCEQVMTTFPAYVYGREGSRGHFPDLEVPPVYNDDNHLGSDVSGGVQIYLMGDKSKRNKAKLEKQKKEAAQANSQGGSGGGGNSSGKKKGGGGGRNSDVVIGGKRISPKMLTQDASVIARAYGLNAKQVKKALKGRRR